MVALIVASCGYLHGSIVVDYEETNQPFLGFGSEVRLGQEELGNSLSKLGIIWARLEVLGIKNCDVMSGRIGDFYRYFKTAMDEEQVRALASMLNRNQVKVMLTVSDIPMIWLDESGMLATDRLGDFARMWGAIVIYVQKLGLSVDYVEVLEGPERSLNGGCSPENAVTLMQLIRAELDVLGFSKIALCGPSLMESNKDFMSRWVQSINPDETGNLVGAWTTRGTEAKAQVSADCMLNDFKSDLSYASKLKQTEPIETIIVTELSTRNNSFHGFDYVSPMDSYFGHTAAQEPAWNVRVIENGLSYLNEGANVLIYPQLADSGEQDSNFGIFTRAEDDSKPQMIHSALRAVFPHIKRGYQVLTTTQYTGSPLYAASFRKKDRVVVSVANSSNEHQNTELQIPGSPELILVERNDFLKGELVVTYPGTYITSQLDVTIPGDSVSTFVFESVNPGIDAEATVHVDQLLHQIEGFGGNGWIGDPGALGFLGELGMSWVRLNLNGVSEFKELGMPRDAYVDYFDHVTEWDRMAYLWSIKESKGLKFMFVSYGAPSIWLGDGNELPLSHAEDLGFLWAAAMKAFADRGYIPEYIELFNEPDGEWDAYCPPLVYNEVVKAARRELDRFNLQEIKIVGPGRAQADLGELDDWIEGLDPEGLAAHDALSIHGWTWAGPESHSSQYVRESTNGFYISADRVDPDRNKPRMMTEFLSKDYVIDGIRYGNQADTYLDTVVDTVPFAVHVTEDLLWHLDRGCNTVLIWQLADQWWETAGWGLMRRFEDGYARKPIFHSLSILLPQIASGFRVIKTEHDGDAYVSAFGSEDTVVVALVNSTDERQIQGVSFSGVDNSVLFNLQCFSERGVTKTLMREVIDGQWVVKLPAHSVTVAILKTN